MLGSQDIEIAFDCMRHDPVSQTFASRGAHPTVVAAVLREMSGMLGTLSLPGMEASEEFDMQRGGKQGGVETPEVSNTVLEWALEPLARSWRERDMGFSFDDNSPALTHLLWADNIWIIAGSMEEFLCMTRELTDTILSIGFRWKDVSLEYMPCGSLRDCSSGALEGYTMVDHMMILGTYLHNDGNTMASLQHRLQYAEKCFWKYAKSFKGKGSIATKLQAWSAGPAASADYSSCSWHLGKHVLVRARRWENNFLRKAFNLKRGPDEGQSQ